MNVFFFFQAEDGIRDLVRSRGLGDVYKRQGVLDIMNEPSRILHASMNHSDADLTQLPRGMKALSLIHI